ncbi:MAG: hypothetical protein KC933_25215 [Myxococcales bacterium]|nr:hypothetical protein [Myxococcales bacterium]
MLLALALVVGAAAHPAPARAEATAKKAAKAPAWDRDELKQIFVRIQAAASAPTVEAKDRGLVDAAAAAYRKTPSPASVEDMAKDVLRTRDPEHPAVQKGQWLTALTRRLYLDLSERCDLVSRFSNTRDDRRYFESMAQQTKAVAQQLGEGLVLVVEGLDVETEALPAVGGSAPTEQGVVAWVHNGGVVTIQKLDRVRFVDHRPPPEHARTTTGALREVYGAQKQFNTFAQTMGKYDSATRGQFGHVQVILPAAYPAIYLNEIVRGGVEAGMHTLHLKTMTPRGELRELVLGIGDAKVVKKKGRGKKKAAVKPEVLVGCEDAVPMGDCARKLQHALEAGAARYAPK